MKTIEIVADTAAEASAKYNAMRDAFGEGASTWPDGQWGRFRISYNGKIWDGGVVIYNPYDDVEVDPIPTPTGFCLDSSIETVWAAIDRLSDDALTEEERDDLNTAMAWITEAIEQYPN